MNDDLRGLAARESAAVVPLVASEPDYVTRLRAYVEGRGVLRGEDIAALLRERDERKCAGSHETTSVVESCEVGLRSDHSGGVP